MSTRRVVITGMGWITPLGDDVEAVWARLLRGEAAIGPVTRFEAQSFATNFAAEVKDFDLGRVMGPAAAAHGGAGLSTQFALAAAARAWHSAKLGSLDGAPAPGFRPRRMGVYLGAGEGSLDFAAFSSALLAGWDPESRRVRGGPWSAVVEARFHPVRELEQEPHLTLSHVATAFGCRGPASNCMTACAASTQATGEAFEIIRRGDADLMFAGGAHSMIHPLGMTGFIRLTAMSTRRDDPLAASRPFDRTRDGFVMGEGAGMLVLEELEHALQRGAEPLAEVIGYGSSADAFRITDIEPDGRGAQMAMRKALRQAGIDPTRPGPDGRPQVHYISAHGTGTQENDGIETAAVKGVFGDLAPKVPFSSVKSMLGHLIQAAGAVELMTCVQAIRTGWLPPTANLHNPDPRCDLDYVPNVARDMRDAGGVEVCISNGFGFGGQNDTVAVRKYRA
ncbi:MAG: beta-ketoacyl-[acyl-carrier-protein] synthase family protein [Phycisphaerales bacterium JB039]